jgi:hypothetical protein
METVVRARDKRPDPIHPDFPPMKKEKEKGGANTETMKAHISSFKQDRTASLSVK